MNSNFFLVVGGAALVPLLIGFVWYHPKALGTAWMKETGITPEDGKKVNMPLVIGFTFLFSLFLSLSVSTIVIHQSGVNSIFAELKSPEEQAYLTDFMAKYGALYRTFKHGVFHGLIATLFIALPIVGINALFERKSFKYIFIHVGYWAVSLMLMGGIICQFA